MSQSKVAVLYICTGDYVYFWEGFYRSFREKFLPDLEKDFFVFTDAKTLYGETEDPHVHKIFQENLGWPGNTLYRFRIFAGAKEVLQGFDYIFYFNANMVCMEEISKEEFLPEKENLLAVQHPGNFNKRPYNYPYERNPKSLAYIPYTCLAGKIYACGGVNGGKADAYLEMITELAQRVDRDEAKGIIARWHDESHINRYLADHPDYRLLTPAYIYPEGWDLPFEEKMVVLDKQKYIPLPPSKVEVYVRPVWYQRYAGYLKTYGERFVTALRRALLELYFRAHGR